MITRKTFPIAPFALVPALALLSSCGAAPTDEQPPLTKAAKAAVTDKAGAPAEELAREIDDLFTKDGLGETRAALVLIDGAVAAERYGEGYDATTRFISRSKANSDRHPSRDAGR